MMPKHLSVIVSQGQSNHPHKRAVEEAIVAGLLTRPGIDVSVVPHLYDLAPDSSGVLCLSANCRRHRHLQLAFSAGSTLDARSARCPWAFWKDADPGVGQDEDLDEDEDDPECRCKRRQSTCC